MSKYSYYLVDIYPFDSFNLIYDIGCFKGLNWLDPILHRCSCWEASVHHLSPAWSPHPDHHDPEAFRRTLKEDSSLISTKMTTICFDLGIWSRPPDKDQQLSTNFPVGGWKGKLTKDDNQCKAPWQKNFAICSDTTLTVDHQAPPLLCGSLSQGSFRHLRCQRFCPVFVSGQAWLAS